MPTETVRMTMKPGYAYELEEGKKWRGSADDDWPIVCYTPDGKELPQGVRYIDAAPCCVFYCTDGRYRAQMTHYVMDHS